MSKKFIPIYDLSNLTEEQKQDYVKALCEHLEVPPELNLVRLIWSDEGDGARRQVAYVLKGATDIIREKQKITTDSLTSQVIGGSITFTAAGSNKDQRKEIAVGAAYIEGIKGKGLDNAIMTAQTRATRRMTLQFKGGGVLDESEINSVTTNIATQSTPLSQLSLAPQPTVAPSSAPGQDITDVVISSKGALADSNKETPVGTLHVFPIPFTDICPGPLKDETQEQFEARQKKLRDDPFLKKTQEQFEARQKKLRDDAIVGLNSQVKPAEEPKKRRGRKPKPAVDLGPSEPPVKAAINPAIQAPTSAPTPPPSPVAEPLKAAINPAIQEPTPIPTPQNPAAISLTPVSAPAARLSQEQVKPYRQRLFKLVNTQLEPNGFAPKEGMGNSDKMRAFATMMFPEVNNLNDLTIVQWEQYLETLENKVKTQGAAATVKYIEDAIGI